MTTASVEATGRCTGLVQLGEIVGTHSDGMERLDDGFMELVVRYGLSVRDTAQASSLGRTYPAEMRERALRVVREGEAAFGSEGDLVWAEPDILGSAETVRG